MSATALPDLPAFDDIVQMVKQDTILGDWKGRVVGYGRKGAKFGISEWADPDRIPKALPESEHEGVTVFVAWKMELSDMTFEEKEGSYPIKGDEWGEAFLPMKAEELKVVERADA